MVDVRRIAQAALGAITNQQIRSAMPALQETFGGGGGYSNYDAPVPQYVEPSQSQWSPPSLSYDSQESNDQLARLAVFSTMLDSIRSQPQAFFPEVKNPGFSIDGDGGQIAPTIPWPEPRMPMRSGLPYGAHVLPHIITAPPPIVFEDGSTSKPVYTGPPIPETLPVHGNPPVWVSSDADAAQKPIDRERLGVRREQIRREQMQRDRYNPTTYPVAGSMDVNKMLSMLPSGRRRDPDIDALLRYYGII